MTPIILRPNAMPVYGFLSTIQSKLPPGETLHGKAILDCGAGGLTPPLALMQQHGLDAWGIEISADQMARAADFCERHSIPLHLNIGDMRALPFDDQIFDYVYEHYAMCHLSKQDTALAVDEIYRVLAPGGYAFLGVISIDTWPRSMFGEERKTGEYWGEEHGEDETLHSLFTEDEADKLVSKWEVVEKEKRVIFLRAQAENMSLETWMGLHVEAERQESQETWQGLFPQRMNKVQYTHIYFIVEKATG
jgi:SAM-dependent methyltransferase